MGAEQLLDIYQPTCVACFAGKGSEKLAVHKLLGKLLPRIYIYIERERDR